MRVRYTPRARDDLESILEYLDRRSPQGAMGVKRSIRKVVDLIGDYPEGGRAAGQQDVRVLPAGRYPYLVYLERRGRRRVDRPYPRCAASAVVY